VALNKCDALDAATVKRKLAALKKASRKDVFPISAVAKSGVSTLLQAMVKKMRKKSS